MNESASLESKPPTNDAQSKDGRCSSESADRKHMSAEINNVVPKHFDQKPGMRASENMIEINATHTEDERRSIMPAWLEEPPENLEVTERTEEMEIRINQLENEGNAYSLTEGGYRKCLIITNIHFDRAKSLPGNAVDKTYLTALFKKLKFEVDEKEDLTAEEIRQTLIDVRETDAECFVCVITSHGNATGILGKDCKSISVRDMTTLFYSDKCKKMEGKPKLFFFDVCRGAGNQVDSKFFDTTETPPPPSDIYVAHATSEGNVSFSDRNHGSWFIRSLVEKIRQKACNCEIVDIVTQVSKEVGTYIGSDDRQQAPERTSTLRKKVFFYIPVHKNKSVTSN